MYLVHFYGHNLIKTYILSRGKTSLTVIWRLSGDLSENYLSVSLDFSFLFPAFHNEGFDQMFFLIKLLDVFCFVFQQFHFQALFLLRSSLTSEKCFSRGAAVGQYFLLIFSGKNFNSPSVFNQREDGQICRQFSAQKIHPIERPDVLKRITTWKWLVFNFCTAPYQDDARSLSQWMIQWRMASWKPKRAF